VARVKGGARATELAARTPQPPEASSFAP
jgi:hypothetical protein